MVVGKSRPQRRDDARHAAERLLHAHVQPALLGEITRDSSDVTHGNVNAVPSGRNATASASTGSDGASGMPPEPDREQHDADPREPRLAEPVDHLPRISTRVNTEIAPM